VRQLLMSLFESTLIMSAVVIVFKSITPLLSRRYSAVGRYYGWFFIVLGFLIPFRIHLPKPILQIGTWLHAIEAHTPLDVADNHAASPASFPWLTIISLLWVAGAVLFVLYHAIRHIHLLNTVRRWSTDCSDPRILGILHNEMHKLSIRANVALRICPVINSPMLLGILRPVILLPSNRASDDELTFILKHELIHFKRCDTGYKLLVLIATAMHWFNPIVYIMAKEIAKQCELSCDELVIRNADKKERIQYAQSILNVMKDRAAAGSFLSSNLFRSKREITKRLQDILDTTNKKHGYIIMAVIAALTISSGSVLSLEATSDMGESYVLDRHSYRSEAQQVDSLESTEEAIRSDRASEGISVGIQNIGTPDAETLTQLVAVYEITGQGQHIGDAQIPQLLTQQSHGHY